MSQLLEDLIATRDALKARGRCKTDLTNDDGQVCLDGAVGVAVIGEQFETADRIMRRLNSGGASMSISNDYSTPYQMLEASPRAMAVVKAIYPLIEQERGGERSKRTVGEIADQWEDGQPDLISAVWIYNDWTNPTDDEVFAMLDKAILNAGGSL